jgi:hypothetical protein
MDKAAEKLRQIETNTSAAETTLHAIELLLTEILKELRSQHETLIQIVQKD